MNQFFVACRSSFVVSLQELDVLVVIALGGCLYAGMRWTLSCHHVCNFFC